MNDMREVRLHCESCGSRQVWTSDLPLQPDERLVFSHMCSPSGLFVARRELR